MRSILVGLAMTATMGMYPVSVSAADNNQQEVRIRVIEERFVQDFSKNFKNGAVKNFTGVLAVVRYEFPFKKIRGLMVSEKVEVLEDTLYSPICQENPNRAGICENGRVILGVPAKEGSIKIKEDRFFEDVITLGVNIPLDTSQKKDSFGRWVRTTRQTIFMGGQPFVIRVYRITPSAGKVEVVESTLLTDPTLLTQSHLE